MSKWKKVTNQDKLDAANERYGLRKKKKKWLDWWDKVKIAIHEDETKDADFEIIEQKKLPKP
jgi:hypothetical protein